MNVEYTMASNKLTCIQNYLEWFPTIFILIFISINSNISFKLHSQTIQIQRTFKPHISTSHKTNWNLIHRECKRGSLHWVFGVFLLQLVFYPILPLLSGSFPWFVAEHLRWKKSGALASQNQPTTESRVKHEFPKYILFVTITNFWK